MEKIKELLKNKKVLAIVGGVLAAIIVVVIVLVLTLNQSNEKQLESTMKELGSSFYEDFYWKEISKDNEEGKKKALSQFTDIGIKVNLDNLSRYNGENVKELVAKMVNKKTKKECNKENTKVTIYPKDPYGQKNYKIEVTLDCGFDKKDKDDKKANQTTTTTTTTTKKAAKKK